MTLRFLACAVGTAAALEMAPQFTARAEAPAQAKQVLWVDGVKNAYPRWSKDGTRILYESNAPESG